MEVRADSLSDLSQALGIPLINESRRYWMVRTNSGLYYQDFVTNKYIAINWDFITPDMLLNNSDETVKKIIKQNIKKLKIDNDDDEEDKKLGIVTAIYTKLNRFIKEFQIGDIVVVPSRDTDYITIGLIESDVYLDVSYEKVSLNENPLSETKLCPYFKRRAVKWLKTIPKAELDIYLQKGLSSHHAVSNIDDYAQFINRSIYDIYQKGSELHAVYHTKNEDGISLFELKEFLNSMSDAIDDVCKASELSYSSKDITLKTNIHSPGIIEICTAVGRLGIAVIGIIFAVNHFRYGGKVQLYIGPDEAGRFCIKASSETKGAEKFKLDNKKLDRLYEAQQKSLIEEPHLHIPVKTRSVLKAKNPMNK